MGRLQHLERLALGRSPFQDSALDAYTVPSANVAGSSSHNRHLASGTAQQYDSKGRPVNVATEERNQAMRNAQNAVLSLVGVVESKDVLSSELEAAARQVRHIKEKLLEAEQDRGDDVELLTQLPHKMLIWWPETLRFRIQAGMFSSSVSFADMLRRELGDAQKGGLYGLGSIVLPGLPLSMLVRALRVLLATGVREGIGKLQLKLSRRVPCHKMAKASSWISLGYDFLTLGIDCLLLPLQYFAMAQRLGLVSAMPVAPGWRLLLPGNVSQLHRVLWRPALGTSVLAATFTSPAAIILFKNFLERDAFDGVPIAHQFTSYEHPPVNAPVHVRLDLQDDPIGQLLYKCYLIRVKVMGCLGWHIQYIDSYPEKGMRYQNNQSFEIRNSTHPDSMVSDERCIREATMRYHSTSLAQLSAQCLSDNIVARVIVQSYLLSGWLTSARAMEAAPHVYVPFGGGPLRAFRSLGLTAPAWREVGSYASKVGLSFALTYAGEVGVFFLVYGLCRWQGKSMFGWGEGRQRRIASADTGTINERTRLEEMTEEQAAT